MTPWGLWVLGLDTEALSVGQASLAGCLEIWEGHPVYSVYSWFFFSFLSPSNLQQKLGTRKKDSIVELGRNLRVFWFWVRSLPWVLGGPSQTQCLTDCRAVLHPKEATGGHWPLEGYLLSYAKAAASIRSQACSSVVHLGTRATRCSPEASPAEVAVTPHPTGAVESGSTLAQTLGENEV